MKFLYASLDGEVAAEARLVRYPCVLKPLDASASRGVIRVDDDAGFISACGRIRRMFANARPQHAGSVQSILVEGFIPGVEVALEGLLENGHLRPLALFDKPDPLDGPYFEETIYVTPSRLPGGLQRDVTAEAAMAAAALGLRHGPIHAEMRINDAGVWMVEMAARTIGGLCSRTLRFAPGVTLEELILRHALSLPTGHLARYGDASGVIMIPIPREGRLNAVSGIEAARSSSAIDDVIISVPIGDWVRPLPEGDRYLGFIFASAAAPEAVESALRHAHGQLAFEIDRSA